MFCFKYTCKFFVTINIIYVKVYISFNYISRIIYVPVTPLKLEFSEKKVVSTMSHLLLQRIT